MKNPKLFRELSEPFESRTEAEEAWNSLFEEIGELRKKHGFQNLHVIVMDTFVHEGDESQFMLNGHFGEAMQGEAMTAWAFGVEQASRKSFIGKLIKAEQK